MPNPTYSQGAIGRDGSHTAPVAVIDLKGPNGDAAYGFSLSQYQSIHPTIISSHVWSPQ
jgi:hypothetical protein